MISRSEAREITEKAKNKQAEEVIAKVQEIETKIEREIRRASENGDTSACYYFLESEIKCIEKIREILTKEKFTTNYYPGANKSITITW